MRASSPCVPRALVPTCAWHAVSLAAGVAATHGLPSGHAAGAFSELAASLNVHGLKLAPSSVWDALPFRVPRAANVTFPSGELSDGARELLRELRDKRVRSSAPAHALDAADPGEPV